MTEETFWHIVENFIPVIGWGFAAWLLIWQMGKQHSQNIYQQKEADKSKLRLELYEKLSEKVRNALVLLSDAHIRVMTLPSKFETYWFLRDNGIQEPTFGETPEALALSNYKANMAVMEIGSLLENYEIAFNDPRFGRAFRKLANMQSGEVGARFNAFFRDASNFIPIPVPEDQRAQIGGLKVLPHSRPSDGDMEKMRNQVTTLCNAFAELCAYVMDASIEMQNSLLGDIFAQKLPNRIPKDPKYFILTSSPDCFAFIDRKFEVFEKRMIEHGTPFEPNATNPAIPPTGK